MTSRRAECPVCHREVAVRKDGCLRPHGGHQDDWRRWRNCSGSHRPVLPSLEPPPPSEHVSFERVERNEEIRRLRREGLTLQEIGDRYGVTRERIRQIVAAGS